MKRQCLMGFIGCSKVFVVSNSYVKQLPGQFPTGSLLCLHRTVFSVQHIVFKVIGIFFCHIYIFNIYSVSIDGRNSSITGKSIHPHTEQLDTMYYTALHGTALHTTSTDSLHKLHCSALLNYIDSVH